MSFEYKASGNALDVKSLRRVFSLVANYRGTVFISVLLTIAMSILGPSIPYFLQQSIDGPIKARNINGLYQSIGLILFMLFSQGMVSYAQSYYTEWLGQQAIYKLRIKTFNHILKMRLSIFDRTPIGTMITRVVSDVETVADIFSEGLIAIAGDMLQIIVILTYMFIIDWKLTLICLSVFPILLLSAWIFKETVKKSFQEVRTQVSKLNAFLQEHITGMYIVQTFNRQNIEFERFTVINKKYRDANIKSILAYSIFFPVIEVLSAISIALIVWGGIGGVLQGRVTIGILIAFISYINLLFRPIRQVADKFNTLQMGMVASERIFQVLDMEASLPNTGTIADDIKGKIEFRNVWFAYADDKWILKDISFTILPGQTIAIVGHTGAGKTSITGLVNRLYTHQKGDILIDDQPIENYDIDALRKQIAVVLQDVFLFSDTINNNLKLYSNKITQNQIVEAVKLVGADSFINNLPGKYDYQVQERGASLSTGQRQLISFIRAIIQQPAILILDEATSSIDQETENMIQKATEILLRGRTSIAIAHRLSTIREADNILVLDKGELVEMGSHDTLISQKGLYHQLYQLQFTELVL
ncbi:MAG: ABC transporter ATP-binding protein [Bacteroidota bacterium]|nr:ABC transporter ATP-binding protein [Bacteroidota bacterium]